MHALSLVGAITVLALRIHCLSFVDQRQFPSAGTLRRWTAKVGDLGLRTTASPRQELLIDYVGETLSQMPGLQLDFNSFSLPTWHTRGDKTLKEAAQLRIDRSDGTSQELDVAGAIPYSAPTQGWLPSAPITYVPLSIRINDTNVKGKIVMRDFGPTMSVPFKVAFLPSYYRTPDTDALLNTSYDRPYTTNPDQDLADATLGGASGFISAFDVPGHFIESYYDPHSGIQHAVPGVYVGKETASLLKLAALSNDNASVSVAARTGPASTHEIFATLPGQSEERLLIICHTDGNTWVQDNGVAATMALAHYFSQQPLSDRNKTLQFVFTSGHLANTHDGNNMLAERLDKDYDNGTVTMVFPLEHMGAREVLPEGSSSGAANGQDLKATGKGELMAWSIGPVPLVVAAVRAAVDHQQLDRMLVTRSADLPNSDKTHNYGAFGGIGTPYNKALIPTASLVSGPWSL